jgi:hypothetical protein
MSTSDVPTPAAGRLAELRNSARGWHGVQLAVIGFIGLCGVLKPQDAAAPKWVEDLAAVLALAALVLACLATYLIGRAAWPLYDAKRAAAPADDAGELLRTSHRLTRGLALTFVAVALLALSSASFWWPAKDGKGAASPQVQVEAQGSAFCGQLADARRGAVRVVTAEQPVEIPIQSLTAIRPVDGC